MNNSTHPALTFENDYIHATTDFGDTPLDAIALARATSRTGTGAAPNALVPAADVADNLTEEHIPDIRAALLDALQNGAAPHNFLCTLSVVGALDMAFPQLAALDGVEAGPKEHHSEGSALRHTLMVMEEYHKLNPNDVTGLLGALAHDLGKAETDPENYPNHYGHAKNGIEPARELASHLGLDEYATAMAQAAEQHMRMASLLEMSHSKIIRLIDTLEKPDGLGIERLLNLLEADGLGRRPQTHINREQYREHIDTAFRVLSEIDERTVRENHPDMDDEHVSGQVLSRRTHKYGYYLNVDE